MSDTAMPQPWIVCVRVNMDSKAYFDRQLTSFQHIKPLLVTWGDDRPEELKELRPSYVMSRPWMKLLPIRGAYRLRGVLNRLREIAGGDPLAASRSEMQEWEALAKRHPPSVLYVHSGFAALRILPLAKRLGVPIVVHFLGLDINSPEPLYQRQITRHLGEIDHAVVVGSWMIPWFTKRGLPRDRITVSPIGAPVEAENGALVPPRPDGRSGCSFIAISRMVAYKGMDRTLEAYAKLLKTHPDARLTMVGNGPLEKQLHQKARELGLDPGRIFTGPLPIDEVRRRLTESDALLHHALDYPDGPEAMPVIVNDAMAMSRPVVVTRCGGMIDQVVDGETGFLVDQEDTDAMARRMAQLADDPDLRARMGKAARLRVEQHFDAVKLARDVETLLLRITGKEPGDGSREPSAP